MEANNKFDGSIAGASYERILTAISPFYHELLSLMAGHAYKALGLRDAVIYDLGCGTGESTHHLLTACVNATIVAVDSSEKMLEGVPAALKTHSRVTWMHADMVDALKAVHDHSLDLISDGYAIHNLRPEERAELYRLLGRKLRPGGLFVCADKIAVRDEGEHRLMLEQRKEEYRRMAALGFPEEAKEWVRHYEFDESIRLTEQELAAGLKNEKFSGVHFGLRRGMYVVAWARR